MGGKSPGAPKQEQKPFDASKTKPSERGILIPYILGPSRTGPVFGAAGNREAYLVQTGTTQGGKGGGDEEPVFTTFYKEKGWHIICLGKMKSLRALNSDGYITGKLTRAAYPSGSTIYAGEEGSFRIYWGEDTQAVNSFIAGVTGVSSQWPHLAFVVWESKVLGESPIWPAIEYEVEIEPQQTTVGGKPAYMEAYSLDVSSISMTYGFDEVFQGLYPQGPKLTTTNANAANFRVGMFLENVSKGISTTITAIEQVSPGTWEIRVAEYLGYTTYTSSGFRVYGEPVSGLNPAAMLYQYLFEPAPFGMGENTDDYNMDDFTAMAQRFALDGPEPTPVRAYLAAGTSFKEGIERLLTDIGAMWWYDHATGKQRFYVLRDGDSPVLIDSGGDGYSDTDINLEFDYATLAPSSIIFSFEDFNRKMQKSTIREGRDGKITYSEDPTSRKVELHSISDLGTASRVASRRAQELLYIEEVPLELSIALKDLPLNGLYQIEGLPYLYRIKSKSTSGKTFKSKVIFVRDTYSVEDISSTDIRDKIVPYLKGPEPDLLPTILEANRILDPTGGGVLVMRVRAHEQIIGARLIMSPDNVSYISQTGVSEPMTGGLLLSGIQDTDPVLIEDGPTFTPHGPDILNVGDLSSSEDLWRSGIQVAVINTEIFYLRNITAISATEYQLHGLIRARLGSDLETHSTGDAVYIMKSSQFVPTFPPYLVNGTTIYAKTLPFTSVRSVDPDDVRPVSLEYKGGGLRPLKVINLNTTADNYAWEAGDDIPIRWSYKNALSETSSGVIRTGVAGISDLPEADFEVQFKTTGGVLKKIVTVSGAAQYTYTNADLVTDFGVEPSSFVVIVISILNGLSSDPVTVTLNKI